METVDAEEEGRWKKRKKKHQKVRVNPCLVLLNVLFACVGIGFVGVGLWLSFNHSTNCIHFLQTVLIGSGLFMVAVAATGIIGTIWGILWLLYLNFIVMLLLILIIVGTTVFVLVITSHGISASVKADGHNNPDPFSGWLRHQVDQRMRSCTQNGQICEFVRYSYASGYYSRPRLSTLQVNLISYIYISHTHTHMYVLSFTLAGKRRNLTCDNALLLGAPITHVTGFFRADDTKSSSES